MRISMANSEVTMIHLRTIILWGVVTVMLLGGIAVAVGQVQSAVSCPDQLAKALALHDISESRRRSAEESWAVFFVRVKQLEESNIQLQKAIEALKNGGTSPKQEPTP